MDRAPALALIDNFLAARSEECGIELMLTPAGPRLTPEGWLFFYNSRAFLEGGALSDCLAGQGPTVLLRDGSFEQGGSNESEEVVLLRARARRGVSNER